MEVHRPKFIKGLLEEIFVILISISLAVAAERIVENYIHNKEGKEALTRLSAEMARDAADFNVNVNIHKNAIEAEDKITDWAEGKIELSDDSIAVLMSNALDFTFFASNTSEFESLKATSKLSYIEDHDLLSKIISNYDRYEDFKLNTTLSNQIVQNIFEKLRTEANYKFNSLAKQPRYFFNGASLKKCILHNKAILNLLQEKKLLDSDALRRNASGFKRTEKLIELIKQDSK
jgi:hypothetical protein